VCVCICVCARVCVCVCVWVRERERERESSINCEACRLIFVFIFIFIFMCERYVSRRRSHILTHSSQNIHVLSHLWDLRVICETCHKLAIYLDMSICGKIIFRQIYQWENLCVTRLGRICMCHEIYENISVSSDFWEYYQMYVSSNLMRMLEC